MRDSCFLLEKSKIQYPLAQLQYLVGERGARHYQRQESGAGVPLVGICPGDTGRPVFLPGLSKMESGGFSSLFYPNATSTIVKSSSKFSEFPKFFA